VIQLFVDVDSDADGNFTVFNGRSGTIEPLLPAVSV